MRRTVLATEGANEGMTGTIWDRWELSMSWNGADIRP